MGYLSGLAGFKEPEPLQHLLRWWRVLTHLLRWWRVLGDGSSALKLFPDLPSLLRRPDAPLSLAEL